jgi:hypothetical protein
MIKNSPIEEIEYPEIDLKFFTDIFNIITIKNKTQGGNVEEINPIFLDFFNNHFKPLMGSEKLVARNKLNQIIIYEIEQIITNLHTNIKMHYTEHLRKAITVLFGFGNEINRIKSLKLSKYQQRKQLKVINQDIYNLYHDLITIDQPKIWKSRDEIKNNDEFMMTLGCLRTLFLPLNEVFYEVRDFHYHIACNLNQYISRMFLLCRQLEIYNDGLGEDEPKIPLFNACPLRRSCIPKYITLDTHSLYRLLIGGKNRQ